MMFLFQSARMMSHRVAVIGSGNWGSVAAKICGENCEARSDLFERDVRMWVRDEPVPIADDDEVGRTFASLEDARRGKLSRANNDAAARQLVYRLHAYRESGESKNDENDDENNDEVNLSLNALRHDVARCKDSSSAWIGLETVRMWWKREGSKARSARPLTAAVQRQRENVRYLPGIRLPENVHAVASLEDAVCDASMLVFVAPHQFMADIVAQVKRADAHRVGDARAVSLVKGMEVVENEPYVHLISHMIRDELGVDCATLMGPNIAGEIAREQYADATLGFRSAGQSEPELWRSLFHRPYFHVEPIDDVEGVELCGTLKNVVALAAGFTDGMNLGNSTRAAIMRAGLHEMRSFSRLLFAVKDETFFHAAGIGDLIATSLGGRNRLCAEHFVRHGGKKSFDDIEHELLGGQKLQGVLTSHEVQSVLRSLKLESSFPLFTTINRIVLGELPADSITQFNPPFVPFD
jgi:glycerol-3-phosphate dehydrogenase (NAD+)